MLLMGHFFMPMAIFSILTLLHSPSTHAICNISHQNERKEESQRKICLPVCNFTIKKYNIEPNVSDDRPNGCNCENCNVLDFLDTQRRSCLFKLFLRASIVCLVDGVDRDS